MYCWYVDVLIYLQQLKHIVFCIGITNFLISTHGHVFQFWSELIGRLVPVQNFFLQMMTIFN